MTITQLEAKFESGEKVTYSDVVAYSELMNARRRKMFWKIYGKRVAFDALMAWSYGKYRDHIWHLNLDWVHEKARRRIEAIWGIV